MPTFPFNQTDLENLYNQNILDTTQIDSKLDLVRIDINRTNDIIQQNGTVYFDVEHYDDKPADVAIAFYKAFIDNIISNNYMIISHELVCSPRPQSIQHENDWAASCYYMKKI
jgi:hypothetical protein